MSKAIEELAEQYVKDVYNGDTDFIYEAECVLTWLFSKPLTGRLTDAEKEMVREDYSDNKCLIESASLSYVQREVFSKINEVLEHIFGKDFFKEDKL